MSKLWEEFIVYVEMPNLPGAGKVPMCGLCGGGGIVDTRSHAKTPGPNGVPAGIEGPCICPNGRAYRAKIKAATKA